MIAHLALVALGGSAGACLRWLLGSWGSAKFPSALPVMTLLINVSGSFLLGALAGSAPSDTASLLLGTGFLGAYTTFSAFQLENVRLLEGRRRKVFVAYAAGSLVLGVLFAWLGYATTSS
jgi:CrcB protein